jgi:hypothetical protein
MAPTEVGWTGRASVLNLGLEAHILSTEAFRTDFCQLLLMDTTSVVSVYIHINSVLSQSVKGPLSALFPHTHNKIIYYTYSSLNDCGSNSNMQRSVVKLWANNHSESILKKDAVTA